MESLEGKQRTLHHIMTSSIQNKQQGHTQLDGYDCTLLSIKGTFSLLKSFFLPNTFSCRFSLAGSCSGVRESPSVGERGSKHVCVRIGVRLMFLEGDRGSLKFSLHVAPATCSSVGDSLSEWRGVDSLDGAELPMPFDFQILSIQQSLERDVRRIATCNWYTIIAPWTDRVCLVKCLRLG